MYCLCREKAPGQRECDEAIEVLNSCIREVDQASLAAISQQLTPREDISMEVSFYTHACAFTKICGDLTQILSPDFLNHYICKKQIIL